MEEDFIKQLKQDIIGNDFGSKQDDLRMWYNKEGDCIQFITTHVATIRKRIDEFLTLYISLEDKKPIGFQLKDIHAFADIHDVDIMIQTDVFSKDKSLISITALILFNAYTKIPESTERRTSYEEAYKTMARKEINAELSLN